MIDVMAVLIIIVSREGGRSEMISMGQVMKSLLVVPGSGDEPGFGRSRYTSE